MSNLQQLAGYIIVAGFALVIITSLIAPNEIYSEKETAARVAIVTEKQARWRVSNIGWGLATVASGIGFVLLTTHLRTTQTAWPLDLGAVAFMLGGVSFAVFAYARGVNPEAYLSAPPWSRWFLSFFWLNEVAFVLYGVAFIQGGYPDWLGYLHIGLAVLLAVLVIIFRSAFFGAIPPQVFYFVTLATGIVTLNRG